MPPYMVKYDHTKQQTATKASKQSHEPRAAGKVESQKAENKKERKKHMIENRVNQNKAKKTAAQFMIDRAKARRQRNR